MWDYYKCASTEIGTKLLNYEVSDKYITREPCEDVLQPLYLTSTNSTTHNPSIRKNYENYIDSGGMVVGPFTLTESVDLNYFSWAVHIFNEEFSLRYVCLVIELCHYKFRMNIFAAHISYVVSSCSEVLFRHRKYEVVRLYFAGLLPNCKIDLQVMLCKH